MKFENLWFEIYLKLLKLLRLFRLVDKKTYNKKRHVLIIKKSALFDRIYYKKQYSDVDFSKITPEEHYLTIGYKEGTNPSSSFSTEEYYNENPDVKLIGMNPLLHYEISGRNEGRFNRLSQEKKFCSYGIIYDCLRKIGQFVYRKNILVHQQVKILVHLHLYYTGAWVEIKEYLKNLSCYPYKLIVTYTEAPCQSDFIADIKNFKSDAKIIPCANKGFDIGPFMEVLKNIKLEDYDIIYHIHSKSVAEKGRLAYNKLFKKKSWFKQLYSGCLGVFNVHKGIKALAEENHFGLVGANNLIVKDSSQRVIAVKKYAFRYGLMILQDYEFLIGSCFGIRANLLSSIQKLHLGLDDFNNSQRSVFTLAHALERIIATEVINAGYQFYKLPVLHNNHWLTVFIKKLKDKMRANKLIRQLEKYGLYDLELLTLDEKSGLNCVFLKGKYKNKPVFIKYGGIEEIAHNEVTNQQKMYKLMPHHVPEVYLYNKNPVFVVMEFIEGDNLEKLLNLGMTLDEQKSILLQIEDIKNKLAHSNVVHRDIQPANLIYTDNKLYLIDYQFMVERNKDSSLKEIDYVAQDPLVRRAIGGIYRSSENDWDDIYSLDLIQKQISSTTVFIKEKNVA